VRRNRSEPPGAFIDHSTEVWNFRRNSPLTAVIGSSQSKLTKGEAMKKTLMALAATAILAVSALAPAPAEAGGNGGVAAGVVGGLIGGAIIGGALAGPGYYGPGYGYYGGGPYGGGPGYYAGGPGYGGCYWQRQRFWDGYGWRIRSVRVCG
jgi:hypothetical protein